MDAVYAWDQQDIHFYVPGGDHHSAIKAICFQTSLMGGGRGLAGWVVGVGHKAEDAGGGVGGGVTTLAEEIFEGVVIFFELLLPGCIVEQVFELPAEVFGGEIVLDQLFHHQFIHDEVDEGNIFYPDEPPGDLIGNGAAFVADDLRHAKEGGFERGGA